MAEHNWKVSDKQWIHLIEYPHGNRRWIVYKITDGYKIDFMQPDGSWGLNLAYLSNNPQDALRIANQYLGPSVQQKIDAPLTPELAEYDVFDQEDDVDLPAGGV